MVQKGIFMKKTNWCVRKTYKFFFYKLEYYLDRIPDSTGGLRAITAKFSVGLDLNSGKYPSLKNKNYKIQNN